VEPNTSKESQTIRGRSGRTQRVRVHIDRGGKLQPAPSPDQPFEKVEAAVDALLKKGS
jgi:hypothetical protein